MGGGGSGGGVLGGRWVGDSAGYEAQGFEIGARGEFETAEFAAEVDGGGEGHRSWKRAPFGPGSAALDAEGLASQVSGSLEINAVQAVGVAQARADSQPDAAVVDFQGIPFVGLRVVDRPACRPLPDEVLGVFALDERVERVALAIDRFVGVLARGLARGKERSGRRMRSFEEGEEFRDGENHCDDADRKNARSMARKLGFSRQGEAGDGCIH